MEHYDLLVKNGRVLDAETELDSISDVAIANGAIERIEPDIDPIMADDTIDAAGQSTTYAYNSRAQITSMTSALAEVTTFTYEENIGATDYARLKQIAGPQPGATTTYTYHLNN